jgi:hypothetical protein
VIDLEEVRFLAAHRCFDVLEFEPDAVAAHVLAGRFDPIAVLDALERIEERHGRANRPLRPASGPPIPHPAKSQAKQLRWPKRAWRTVPKGWGKDRIPVK